MKKSLIAAALLVAGGNVSAAAFYMDVGADYGGIGVKYDGGNTTGLFDQATVSYWSTTTVTDSNNDGIYNPGDTAVGTGGLLNVPQFGIGTNDIGQNLVTGFLPTASFANPTGPSTNNYLTDWVVSFGWNDLSGVVNPTGGISYNGGTVNVYFMDATNPYAGGVGTLVMKIDVTGGGNNAIGQSLNIFGDVSFDGIDPNDALNAGVTIGDLFNFTDGSFGDLVGLGVRIGWDSDQNTEPFFINGDGPLAIFDPLTFYSEVGGTGVISGQHDGSFQFVPEPSTLALLGGSMLLLGGMVRRNKKS